MSFKTINLKTIGDERGSLIALENNAEIPFDVKRVYYIFNTQDQVSRGFHAHINLKQMAICVAGSCKFILDDGVSRSEVLLSKPDEALYIEGLIWREMHDFSEDCVLLVLASQVYDEADYIRNYSEFKRLV
ncbi:FdtA/QdtA family cupin domain-containing protein [Vibrio pelagius]|uniref:sugar 3,4-ketoisomerase n=1 Tax=Vibrio pelagius TaxID=28169 RepID=UPI0035512168